MSTGLRLFCPAEATDWSVALITEREVELCRSIASRLGLAISINKEHGKLYLGRGTKPPVPPSSPHYLDVPYYPQWDSETGQAHRMCFSSSCAMLLSYLKPDALTGPGQPDDQYLRRLVGLGGDTTNSQSQLRTLAAYGVSASFTTDLSWPSIDDRLSKKIPVPIGILHHGTSARPTGGGHWIVVIEKKGGSYICHDPAGVLNLQHGGYGSDRNGAAVEYNAELLGRRWMVDGPGTGWGIIATR